MFTPDDAMIVFTTTGYETARITRVWDLAKKQEIILQLPANAAARKNELGLP